MDDNAQAIYEHSFKLLLDQAKDIHATQSIFSDIRNMLQAGELAFSDKMATILSDFACDASNNMVAFHVPGFVATLAVGGDENCRMTLETLRRIVAGSRDHDTSSSALYAAGGIFSRMPEMAEVTSMRNFSDSCEAPQKKKTLKDIFLRFAMSQGDGEKVKKALSTLEKAVTKALLKRLPKKDASAQPRLPDSSV